MNLLLDSHALLWLMEANPNLSVTAAGLHRIMIHGRLVQTPRWQQAYGDDYHYTGRVNQGLIIENPKADLSQPTETNSHLHVSLRGNIEQSPEEIALAYLNNLAFAVGQQAIWEFGYYVGRAGRGRNAWRNPRKR